MRLLLALAWATLCLGAVRFTSKKSDPLLDLQEVTKNHFRATQNALQPVNFAETDTAASLAVIDKNFDQIYQLNEVKPHSKTKSKTKPHTKKNEKHHKKTATETAYNEAARVDRILYGGKTYHPKPGDENYFDFDSFHRYTESNNKVLLEHYRSQEQGKKDYSNSSTGDVIEGQSIGGCLEISICLSDTATAGSVRPPTDVCGIFGYSGEIGLETNLATGEQTLTVTASVGVGMVVKASKAFALSIYLQGQAAWEFAIESETKGTGRYNNVWEALLGAAMSLLQDWKHKSTVNNQMLTIVKDARKRLADDFVKIKETENKQKGTKEIIPPNDPAAQTNELKDMVNLHYRILNAYADALVPFETSTPNLVKSVQNALGLTVATAVWDFTDENVHKFGVISKNNISTAIDGANLIATWFASYGDSAPLSKRRFECTQLNEETWYSSNVTGLDRKSTTGKTKDGLHQINKALGYANVLFCALFKFGVPLQESDRVKGDILRPEESDLNVAKSILALYKEIVPNTVDEFNKIKATMQAFQVAYKAVKDSDWSATKTSTLEYKDKDTNKPATETTVVPVTSVIEVTNLDPCGTARALYQMMSLPSEQLEDALNKAGVASVEAGWFSFKSVKLTGRIGISLGAEFTFCDDADKFQVAVEFGFAYKYERQDDTVKDSPYKWTTLTPRWFGKLFISEYFHMQISGPVIGKIDAENPLKFVFTINFGVIDLKLSFADVDFKGIFDTIQFLVGQAKAIDATLSDGLKTSEEKNAKMKEVMSSIFNPDLAGKIASKIALHAITALPGAVGILLGQMVAKVAEAALKEIGVEFEVKMNEVDLEVAFQLTDSDKGLAFSSFGATVGVAKSVSAGYTVVKGKWESKKTFSYKMANFADV